MLKVVLAIKLVKTGEAWDRLFSNIVLLVHLTPFMVVLTSLYLTSHVSKFEELHCLNDRVEGLLFLKLDLLHRCESCQCVDVLHLYVIQVIIINEVNDKVLKLIVYKEFAITYQNSSFEPSQLRSSFVIVFHAMI